MATGTEVGLLGGEAPQNVPLGIFGSLPTGTVELILEKSEVNVQGVMLVLGGPDAGYQEGIVLSVKGNGIQSFISGMKMFGLFLLPCWIPGSKER